MLISIIIPIHNVEQYIGKCLQSIVRQRYDKSQYEIIAVLTCTDCSEAIVMTALEDCDIAHTILRTDCKSAGLSRNAGLEIARGKYIYFVDGDDYLIDLLALKRMTEAMESGDYNAVYMNKFESDQKAFDDDAIWRYFYKRDIIGETRFTDARINEDWEFTRTIGLCPKMKYPRAMRVDIYLHLVNIERFYYSEQSSAQSASICSRASASSADLTVTPCSANAMFFMVSNSVRMSFAASGAQLPFSINATLRF